MDHMNYAARLQQLCRLIEPIVNGADPPRSAFTISGRVSDPADKYSAAHDAILLNDHYHKATAIAKHSLSVSDFTKLGLLGEGQFGKVSHTVSLTYTGSCRPMHLERGDLCDEIDRKVSRPSSRKRKLPSSLMWVSG